MSLFRSFLHDRRGATAALMAIALVPVIGTLAISADYSKVMKQKYALQQVVDSTATALAKDTDLLLLSGADLQTRANGYAKAVSGSVPVDNLSLTARADQDRVTIEANGEVKLTFAKILGTDSLVVQAAVTVERSKAKKIELALALDNTGSMKGEKIAQLKAAVRALVDFMSDPKKNSGSTKISLVPFGTYVKTDPAWMASQYLESKPPYGWDGCLTDRTEPYNTRDTRPSSAEPDSLYWWRIPNKGQGHGYGNDEAVECGDLARIIPLTSDLSKIKTAADSMIATGNTNVPIGLVWAWHSLTNGLPLTEGSPDGTESLQRAIIVLTDGENTADRWGNNKSGKIDKRLTELCGNIKATGTLIYTVRVIDGDAELLKSCATTPTHYYNVTQASQLTPVFEQIAASLSKMRISR